MAESKLTNPAGAGRFNHSKAARRHLRNIYGAEQQLRALLDSIYYGTVGGESCTELNDVLQHLGKAVALITAVESRETARFATLTQGSSIYRHADRAAA